LRFLNKISKNIVKNQILFTEFVDWALEKNLDIEDDDDAEIPDEEKDE